MDEEATKLMIAYAYGYLHGIYSVCYPQDVQQFLGVDGNPPPPLELVLEVEGVLRKTGIIVDAEPAPVPQRPTSYISSG